MKPYLTALLVLFTFVSCSSSAATTNDLAINLPIETILDLTQVNNDKVPVTINPGRFTIDKVTYRLPKVIPGDYHISDFGNFIDDFIAYDYNGNEMKVEKVDNNSWIIEDAVNLDKITYYVNDTFDIERTSVIPTPFSPSGTNIHPENYLLNLHGFIGYFDILQNNAYNLDVIAPSIFVRSSALKEIKTETSPGGTHIKTSYHAPRYFDIIDNPMMYGNLDVEEFQVGDIRIVLSVYSPNKVHSAKGLKDTVYKMMEAQKAYLGDINNTPRYDIYLYLADNSDAAPTQFGALEHHTSTVVVLRERSSKDSLSKSILDIVAHEFFHIVTPLNVHSEHIHNFDYNQPIFSRHLWMYEGVTEYFANHFQVKEGLISEDEFFRNLIRTINISYRFDDSMSFTKMSQNITEEPFAENFSNVYYKGALIGMCIDILMREESQGKRGLLSLMKELSLKYGNNMPFEDEKIIEEISLMTYPSVYDFLKTHVEGTTPIDYEQFFEKVGLRKVGWFLKSVENPTKDQLDLRNAWLKG